jgi:tRNA U34 2-thiouridine synthase MnmA/TrmU
VGVEDGILRFALGEPQRTLTPVPSVVFYKDQQCLGGTAIDEATGLNG